MSSSLTPEQREARRLERETHEALEAARLLARGKHPEPTSVHLKPPEPALVAWAQARLPELETAWQEAYAIAYHVGSDQALVKVRPNFRGR